MRVDITLHEVSDTYEETSLDGIKIPRLPRVGETVHLTLPEREVGGKVILVGHRFAIPGGFCTRSHKGELSIWKFCT